ncbi:MAG: phage holin family protein [Chlorobium sp.]|nr:MAG: phage holin family protein [Chlorobium sp.]
MMNRRVEKDQPSTEVKRKNTGIQNLIDDTVTSTYEDVVSIIDAKIELLKIELTDKVSRVAATIILAIVMIIGIVYLVTTFALLAGELLGHPFLGYLLVSLVFLSCFVFFTKIKPLLLKTLIQNILLSVHDYKK